MIGKVITGLTIIGQPDVNRLAIGVGMIPRGEVGLVFAGVGSASGALSRPLEAAIIVMVILTTFVAPPLLRLAFQTSDPVPLDADVDASSDTSEPKDSASNQSETANMTVD